MPKNKQPKTFKRLLGAIAIITIGELLVVLTLLLQGKTVALLQPAGSIAEQQKDLMLFAAALSLVVIIPVFTLLGYILWKYRDGNAKANYRPNWDSSKKLETIWWGLPFAIITILAVVTYQTSHSLDPYKQLSSNKEPVTIQVVSLQWKWLFLYPDQKIATINHLKIPKDTPINFEITSDAPMNSFWIPQLGGQVYAMTGMETKLHLIADKVGTYEGRSANISGEGFAGMTFTVDAVDESSFDSWIKSVKKTPDYLNGEGYAELTKPSHNNPIAVYADYNSSLYDDIITKYNKALHKYGGQH